MSDQRICDGCPKPVPADGPSDVFCSQVCQYRALPRMADMPDGWGDPGYPVLDVGAELLVCVNGEPAPVLECRALPVVSPAEVRRRSGMFARLLRENAAPLRVRGLPRLVAGAVASVFVVAADHVVRGPQ